MVGMFEDPTQLKEWASRRAACIWCRDTQGKFHGTLFRREALGCGCILGHRGVHASSSLIPNPAEEFLSIMPPEATSGSW